ncbi:hypothetical protein BCR44DRAFT_1170082 [Catenaria anguillulae PL171]|uniref:Uncharacterized protein n=1 Tax=Catenaria anguillulae PL171 TaxID=765915 RepID=A0A1Y2HZZ2_9FUNG|nr:hypothetical protein BCR44DRAFT_1170082 [Catenaria anguillulae PL171]
MVRKRVRELYANDILVPPSDTEEEVYEWDTDEDEYGLDSGSGDDWSDSESDSASDDSESDDDYTAPVIAKKRRVDGLAQWIDCFESAPLFAFFFVLTLPCLFLIAPFMSNISIASSILYGILNTYALFP